MLGATLFGLKLNNQVPSFPAARCQAASMLRSKPFDKSQDSGWRDEGLTKKIDHSIKR